MKLLVEKAFLSFYGLLAVAMIVASGCATTSDPVFTSDPAKETLAQPGRPTNDYRGSTSESGVRFQMGDLVIITFSDTPEPILPHEERIKEDGNITLPLVGAVKAAGKQAGELQKEIHDRYVPKYYVRLTVTVKPQSMEQVYSVLGEVRAPGPKPYVGLMTVTKAIGAAGGLTDFASKKSIWLLRSNGSKIKVNYREAIADSKKDPQVFPGDSINVEKSIW